MANQEYLLALAEAMVDAAGNPALLEELADMAADAETPPVPADEDEAPADPAKTQRVQEWLWQETLRRMETGGAFSWFDMAACVPPSAQFGMVGDEWHGETPPGPDWVQVGRGPKGGKIWRRKSGGSRQQQQTSTASPQAAPKKPTKPPWAMSLEEIKSEGVKFFKTGQGSIYAWHPAGQSVRIKSSHVGHETKDTGLKRGSEATYFVAPEDARRIGMWQTSSARNKRLIVRDGWVLLTSRNDQAGEQGKDGEPMRLHNAPAAGLSPLELWEPSSQGGGWWKASHPGSPITEGVSAEVGHSEFVKAARAGGKNFSLGEEGHQDLPLPDPSEWFEEYPEGEGSET